MLRSSLARARHPGLLLLDYFADDDLAREPRVLFAAGAGGPRSTSDLGRAALALAADGRPWGGLVFTGGLENRPGLLRLLARRAPILGNDPAAVAAVRDTGRLASFLEKEGLPHAGVSLHETVPWEGRWLFKRRRGAGGSGIREARPGERRRPGEYLQRRLEGIAGSIAFVANGNEARLLGATVEVGPSGALAAPPHRYAGNIAGPIPALLPGEALATLVRGARRITARFELRGLNGIDYVLTERGPVVLEVNPRFTASMEILEDAEGASFFDGHLEALDGVLRGGARMAASGWRAKGILYADRSVIAPDPQTLVPLGVCDRPRRGLAFEAGQPLCTLIVDGKDADDCRRRLDERAVEARRHFTPIGV